jgi:hypothetical protein
MLISPVAIVEKVLLPVAQARCLNPVANLSVHQTSSLAHDFEIT